jgi:hypothetical protein
MPGFQNSMEHLLLNRYYMKPVLILIAGMVMKVHSLYAQDIDKVMISLDLQRASLEDLFQAIEELTPFTFNYKTSDISDVRNIRYQQQSVSVKKVLDDLLSATSLQYEQMQQYIVIRRRGHQQPLYVTLYGFVRSVHSGEALSGATVSISGRRTYAAVTNAYGFYSISLPAGCYQLNCSSVGFREYENTATLQQSIQNNISLPVKEDEHLQTVTVATAGKKNMLRKVMTGNHRLSMADIKKIPMAGGEPDVLKSLQFLPGIQVAAEGTTNLSVRGGSYDQNLILLDEAPVYNPTHTLGLFSAFNTDALKDVAVYKGVFPTQYGSRLSSVVDMRMKEGNSKQHAVSGGIGLLAARLTWEGPVQEDRSSFIISGRYSNIGALVNYFSHATHTQYLNSNDARMAFYDAHAKFNTVLSKKDRLYISAYTGHDRFFLHLFDKSKQSEWGNTTVTARWNHVFNSGVFANTSLLYSQYNYSNGSIYDTRNFTWRARLQEMTLKTDIDRMIIHNMQLKFGLGVTGQHVLPGKVVPHTNNTTAKATSLNSRNSAQVFAYINNEHRISKSITASYGIRATYFAALGDAMVYRYSADTSVIIDSMYYPKGKVIKSYFGAEPKATLRVLLSNATSLKFSYGRNYQFQHLLTNSMIGLPTDIWMPSDTYFKPQFADQFAAGVYKTLHEGAYEASVELYYRKSFNIIDFKDNAEVFMNDNIETQVRTGQGKGYGMEWLIKKNKGASNGWLSYTLSKSLRRVDGVNNNEWYSCTYDHRHNFSLVYNYTLNKRWSVAGNWVYRSGGHTTVPVGSYVFNGVRFLYYGERNGYTLPANHRLDISVTWRNKFKPIRKWQSEWVLSVYNVYNRKNVFALYVSQDPGNFIAAEASAVHMFGILPSITYNFKF